MSAKQCRKSIHPGAGSAIILSRSVIPGAGQDKVRHGQPCTAQKRFPALGGIIGKMHWNCSGRPAVACFQATGFSHTAGGSQGLPDPACGINPAPCLKKAGYGRQKTRSHDMPAKPHVLFQQRKLTQALADAHGRTWQDKTWPVFHVKSRTGQNGFLGSAAYIKTKYRACLVQELLKQLFQLPLLQKRNLL